MKDAERKVVMKNENLRIIPGKELKEGEFGFGVSLDIGEEKGYRLTGIYPSPAFPDLRTAANVILDFFNGHLGTNFVAVEQEELVKEG
jgi:hypothetical protein